MVHLRYRAISRRRGLIYSALVLLAIAGCSPPVRARMVRFFFEVPAEPTTTQPAMAKRTTTGRRVRGQGPRRIVFASQHPPFLRRKCVACHDPDNANQPRADLRTVCSTCHPDTLRPAAFTHGPVAAGACTQCHLPHVSALPKLLVQSDPRLCLDCHEMTQPQKCSGQVHAAGTPCLTCHEPHTAEFEYMLKPREVWEHLLPGTALATRKPPAESKHTEAEWPE